MSLKAVIGALRVNLSANTAAFSQGMNEARGSLSGFMGKVSRVAGPVAAVGGAIAAAGAKAAQAAKQIKLLADISGAGVEEFQKAAHAAQTVGVGQEKLADIFKDTNDKIGDFIATGGGELKDFFEEVAPKVGVTAEEFKNLSGPEALQKYVATLEKAGVSQKEMVFYLESIADEGSALIPLLANQGAEMNRLGNEAESLGLISEKQAATAVKLTGAWNKAMGALKAVAVAIIDTGLIDLLARILGFSADMIVEVGRLVKRLVDLAKVGVARLKETAQAFVDLKDRALAAIKNMVTGIKDWMLGGLRDAAQGALDFKDSVLGWFSDTEDEAVGNSIIPDMVQGITKWMQRLPKEGGQAAKSFSSVVLDSFDKLATSMVDRSRSIQDALKGVLVDLGKVAIEAAAFGTGPLGKAFGGGLESLLTSAFTGGTSAAFPSVNAAGASGLGQVPLIPSFAGGGFTGAGPRSGGMDGQGGFLAMLHPNEMVSDARSGSGDQYVTINNSINASGLSPAQAAAMIERSNRRTLERVREQQTRGA